MGPNEIERHRRRLEAVGIAFAEPFCADCPGVKQRFVRQYNSFGNLVKVYRCPECGTEGDWLVEGK